MARESRVIPEPGCYGLEDVVVFLGDAEIKLGAWHNGDFPGAATGERSTLLRPAGAVFPPIDVFFGGAEYWLADGFHRLGAYNIVMQALELARPGH